MAGSAETRQPNEGQVARLVDFIEAIASATIRQANAMERIAKVVEDLKARIDKEAADRG